MRLRNIIICLLVVTMSATSAARPPTAPPDENSRITPEEVAEARELVAEFNRKFAETNDIAPLVEDYFVADFAARLIDPPNVFPFFLIDWKDKNAPAKPDDLLRFYVAATNFLHDFFPLYAAGMRDCAEEKNNEPDEKCDGNDPKPEKFLPPAAVEVMKAAPQFKQWLGSEDDDAREGAGGQRAADSSTREASPAAEVAPLRDAETLPAGECAEGCAGRDGGKERLIQNEKELRHLTSVLESLNKILRAHLEAHPVLFENTPAAESDESDDDDEIFNNFDPAKIKIFDQARVTSAEFYGYPEGTRLVCANAGALHVELVRVDGRLRVLTVYLLIGD